MDLPDDARRIDRLGDQPSDSLAQACRRFTTLELCLAWQQSCTMSRDTQEPTRRLSLAKVRAAFLDELERRDRPALVAWLQSDTPADQSPLRFFGPRLLGTDA
jgi:hypothetical protein